VASRRGRKVAPLRLPVCLPDASVGWEVARSVPLSTAAAREGALGELRVMQEVVRAAEVDMAQLVLALRGAGVLWERIGDALGVTKQAAQQRFGGEIRREIRRGSVADPSRSDGAS
jgi:hypothetical protein